MFTAEVDSQRFKLLQIMFGKDGSLFVNFPYFKYREGLTSVVKIPANISYPTNAELNPGGKATTHLVKYSHHPDGRVHFSQDGRVRSTVRKQSVTLREANEHLFTIKIQGLKEFEVETVNRTESNPKKRRTFNLRFQKMNPEALKIVGRWYSQTRLIGKIRIKSSSPIFLGMSKDGRHKSWGVLLGNPYPINNENYFLMVNFEPIAKFDKQREASLTFIGGFDPPHIIHDRTKETTFLAFTYPVSNIDDLVTKLGSIDLIRKSGE